MKLINDTTKEKVVSQSKEILAKSQDNLEKAAKEVEKSLNRYYNKYTEAFSSTFNSLYNQAFDLVDFEIVDRTETEDGKMLYSMDMPGVKLSDIEIVYQRGSIDIKATRTDRNQKADIQTSFTLDSDCDPDSAKANLKDGVLTLTFNKVELKEPEHKRIAIEEVE